MATESGSFPTSRGAVLLTGSQAVGLVAGFIAQVVLTRLLIPEIYGLYAVTVSVLAWIELVVNSSIAAPLAKAVSEGVVAPSVLWGWVWRIYFPLWVVGWLAISLCVGWVAAVFRDARLVPLLLVAVAGLPFVGLFTASHSLLAGLRAHGWQAVLLGLQPMLRLIGVLIVAFVTRSVLWVLAANTLATMGAALAGIVTVRSFPKRSKEPIASSASSLAILVGSGLPLMVISLLDQITLSLDLWLLKRMAEPQATGFYGASRFLAIALLMLAGGLGASWFPAMCQALGQGEREKAKALLREALSVLVIGFGLAIGLVWTTARPLTVLLFSPSFEPAAEPMRWLVIAIALMVLMFFLRGALIADNDNRSPLLLAAVLAVLDFALCRYLILTRGMEGAAQATTLTGLFGFAIAFVLAARRFGNVLPVGTIVRSGIASIVIGLIASVWSVQGIMLIGQYLLLTCLCGGLLFATGEIGAKELRILRVVFADIVVSVADVVRKRGA